MGEIHSIQAVRIFTADLKRAEHFYGDVLGFRRSNAGDGYALFDLAGVDVVVEAMAADDPEGRALVGRLLAVSFRVDDVEASYRRLSGHGVTFVQPPEKQAWGGTLAFLRDPDGNVLTLVS